VSDIVASLAWVVGPFADVGSYVQDLLDQHGLRFVEEIAAAAAKCPSVTRALWSVVFDDDSEHRRIAERLT
jgi:hypothetical protein